MLEGDREDIFKSGLEYMCISLISSKLRVLIVGGGMAGYIKCRTFSKKGCNVIVLSKEFIDQFEELKKLGNVKLIDDDYSTSYIMDKHIVVIAVDDEKENEIIRNDCEKYSKIYLDCSNFKRGIFVNPLQGETKNICFSVNTKGGSPKTSRFLSKKIHDELEKYDELAGYICNLRSKIKGSPRKNEIMSFVSSDDFNFFYKKGYHKLILTLFYGGKNFELENCDAKK